MQAPAGPQSFRSSTTAGFAAVEHPSSGRIFTHALSARARGHWSYRCSRHFGFTLCWQASTGSPPHASGSGNRGKDKTSKADALVRRHRRRSAAEDSTLTHRPQIPEDKPQRGLFARFFLLYRMTSGTARLLRVICYATFAFWVFGAASTVSDALSHSFGYIGDDVVGLVVFAVPTVASGFAAAAVDARARRRRAAVPPDSLSHPAEPPADRIPIAECAPGRSNPSATPAAGVPPRGKVKLYGRHVRRNRWIGWSVIGVLMAVGVAAAIGGSPDAFYACLLVVWMPWLFMFNRTRPVMWTSGRGLTVMDFPERRVIPWDQVERVALIQNGQFHVVVQAYAGSVTIDRVVERQPAQKTFTDFVASIDQFHQTGQLASPSAAEASVNRGTEAGNSARHTTADRRAQARMRAELRTGSGVQLDGAGTAATTYWAPDPTGTHELRLIRHGRWTPMVVTAGLPGSHPALSEWASFEWIGPATAPTRSAASEWFAAGTYVFRSTWKNRKPIWYSAVRTDNRPIFLIEDLGWRFKAVDSGISYPAAHRSRTRLGSHFSDNGRSIRATRKGTVIDSTTGTSIASTYTVANQRPDTRTGDHTVVITVPNAIPMPLGLLILSYATRKRPYFRTEAGGG